jgi:hypothetical protein
MNCGCTDGESHSLECHAEHAAAIAGGVFVKEPKMNDMDRARKLIEKISEKFKERVKEKPSWGSTTLAALHNEVVSQVLLEEVFNSETKK